jgi:hypothetical protein
MYSKYFAHAYKVSASVFLGEPDAESCTCDDESGADDDDDDDDDDDADGSDDDADTSSLNFGFQDFNTCH